MSRNHSKARDHLVAPTGAWHRVTGRGWHDLATPFTVLFALGLCYLGIGAWHLKRRLR
jgi:hypothetical protein